MTRSICPNTKTLPYRPCAGLCVINRKGLVFIGRRTDGPEHIDETHVWQMPQGGIDDGEKPYPAALRELYEETSIKSVEKLGEIKGWLIYDIPKSSATRRGRESTAARRRNGTHCASPARTVRSTSTIRAAGTSRSSSIGAGSRWRPARSRGTVQAEDLRAGGEGVLQVRQVPMRPERAKGTSKRRSQVKRKKR